MNNNVVDLLPVRMNEGGEGVESETENAQNIVTETENNQNSVTETENAIVERKRKNKITHQQSELETEN